MNLADQREKIQLFVLFVVFENEVQTDRHSYEDSTTMLYYKYLKEFVMDLC